MIPPCLRLSNIRYISRVKWSNPGKGVTPSLTPRCSSYWKGSLLVALFYGRQLYLLIYVYIYICVCVCVCVCACVCARAWRININTCLNDYCNFCEPHASSIKDLFVCLSLTIFTVKRSQKFKKKKKKK